MTEQAGWDDGHEHLHLFLSLSLSEEAVNEVKRQAMSELQKAVSDAERKAHEMISAERSKMERALAEAKRQASEDALTVINQQEDSSEVSITDPPPTFCPILLSSHLFSISLLCHSFFGFLFNSLLLHPLPFT